MIAAHLRGLVVIVPQTIHTSLPAGIVVPIPTSEVVCMTVTEANAPSEVPAAMMLGPKEMVGVKAGALV